MTLLDAVVIGSGPNGLTAALTLAAEGASVLVLEAKDTPGGGMRTAELTLPGFHHDVCSAIHPMAAAGNTFPDLGVHIDWVQPEVMAAHPLDDGSAGVILGGIEETAAANDAPRWKHFFGSATKNWSEIDRTILGPTLKIPQHPVIMARLGAVALVPATAVARSLGNPTAAALFVGVAAHANTNLGWPLSSSAGLGLIAAGHNGGWPAARGGSQHISDALVARLIELGGSIECNQHIASLNDLPPAKTYLFDTTPWQLSQIAGDRIPPRTQRAWNRFRRGSGSFKIDYALDGPVPWTNADARRAGTVHLGGTWQEVAAAEAEVRAGRPAERPYVLVGQQSLIDDTRAPEGKHTLWAYCHVPHGCSIDQTEALEAQIERFAPGWRDLIAARAITAPAALENYNENYIGGSIDGGASELHQVLFRPDFSVDPYRVGDTNMWLASSSTPPGGGVHGICGARAARSVLRSDTLAISPT